MTTALINAGSAAFGDGTHPSTQGAIAALGVVDPEQFSPRIACDIGAGSGIVSFAVIAKFSCPVLAVDIARSAVHTIRQNAERNAIALPLHPIYGQAGILPVRADGFDHPDITASAPFDLMVMNILAAPLLRLAADAQRLLAEDGVLILSGILQWQEATIRTAYTGLGLELTFRLSIGGWVTLLFQKATNGGSRIFT